MPSLDVVGTDELTQRVSSISRGLNSLSLLKVFFSDQPGCCYPWVNISKWVFALCFGETGVPRNVYFFGWDWWDWLSIPTCWTTIHAQGTMTTYNFSKLTSPWFLPRILGVDRNASQEDIKKAYKKQVHVLRGSSFTCQVCRWCQGWGKIAKRRKVDLLEIFGGLGCYLKLNPGNKGPHRKVCWNIFNKDLKIQFWTFFTLRDLYGSRFWAPSSLFFCF